MFIGLDIGTSGTKAALADRTGNVLQSFQVNYNFMNAAPGYRELDAEEVWRAVKRCLAEAGTGQQIQSITVSSLGEAILPVSRKGTPLFSAITGTDSRGLQEMKTITRKLKSRRITDITGLNMSHIYSAAKMLWMKKNQPDIFEQAWKIATFQDYAVLKLAGEAYIDYSMASRTLLFDIRDKNWSKELTQLFGIPTEKLGKPVRAGTPVGTIRRELAEELNLNRDVCIVVGAHDHICNAIGSGIYREGECADTVGTTEGLTAIIKEHQLRAEAIEKYQISCEPFVEDGLFNTVAWQNTSGVMLKWFVQQFGGREVRANISDTFLDLNKKIQEKPTSLLVLPHFSGAATPYTDPESKGAILGLTLQTEREELYKALMEGANYEVKLIMDSLKKSGVEVKRMAAAGGALSPELLQIKADILGMEIEMAGCRQSGTLGGAILGAVACGEFNNLGEAVQEMVRAGKLYYPDLKRHHEYQEKQNVYNKLYSTLQEINHSL